MASKTLETMSREAWNLAARQHGVIARRQLVIAGFSRAGIEHRRRTGRLHVIHRGVYAVGRPELSREGRWMAAVLACGDGALLSHRSAAALWRIETEARGLIDVTIARHGDLRRPGIRIRARAALRPRAFDVNLGIPVTDPVQTLLDLATELSPSRVERAVNEADKHDLVDPESLRKELERQGGVPGVRVLREILDRHTFRLSDSELERRFRPLARAAGLPEPLTKQLVDGFEVDFHWPGLGLVVETDGWRYHRTPAAQSRDALRFQAHAAAGRTPLRFSHRQIARDPAHVVAVLTAIGRRLAPGRAAASRPV